MAWCLEKFPNKCIIRGAKTRYKQNVPQKNHHPSFTPNFAWSNHVTKFDFPQLPQEKKWSPFFCCPSCDSSIWRSCTWFTEFLMDFRSRSMGKPFIHSRRVNEDDLFSDFQVVFLSNLYLQNFVSKLWGLQKSPKVSSNTTCLGDLGWGRSFFCRPWQIWFFLQQLCRLCTQQNTKGTEWESPSCRPVSHNSTRTSGRMQKSVGCFCLEKMKPEKLRKKWWGNKKSNEFDVFLFVTH